MATIVSTPTPFHACKQRGQIQYVINGPIQSDLFLISNKIIMRLDTEDALEEFTNIVLNANLKKSAKKAITIDIMKVANFNGTIALLKHMRVKSLEIRGGRLFDSNIDALAEIISEVDMKSLLLDCNIDAVQPEYISKLCEAVRASYIVELKISNMIDVADFRTSISPRIKKLDFIYNDITAVRKNEEWDEMCCIIANSNITHLRMRGNISANIIGKLGSLLKYGSKIKHCIVATIPHRNYLTQQMCENLLEGASRCNLESLSLNGYCSEDEEYYKRMVALLRSNHSLTTLTCPIYHPVGYSYEGPACKIDAILGRNIMEKTKPAITKSSRSAI